MPSKLCKQGERQLSRQGLLSTGTLYVHSLGTSTPVPGVSRIRCRQSLDHTGHQSEITGQGRQPQLQGGEDLKKELDVFPSWDKIGQLVNSQSWLENPC